MEMSTTTLYNLVDIFRSRWGLTRSLQIMNTCESLVNLFSQIMSSTAVLKVKYPDDNLSFLNKKF